MDLQEVLGYGINSLRQRKLRSFLTVLGIVVGISSIVLLVGLVQGLKKDVLKELESFGPRTLIITPTNLQSGSIFGAGSSFAPTSGKLFERDYERVKHVAEIATITKVISGSTTVQFKDQAIDAQIFAVEPESFTDTIGIEVASGRFLKSSDQFGVVVGSKVATSFDEPLTSSSNLIINGKKYRVVGILKETGNSFGPVDSVIFISFDSGHEIFSVRLLDKEISAIRITLKEGSDLEKVSEEVEDIMAASHRVSKDEEDFGVISPAFINKQFSGILDLLTIFLGAIASISLIVGGIGISNTMFMSVLERRKEIGTLKAVGATTHQIRDIFLIESSLIGFVGGILGVVIALFMGFLLITLINITFVFDNMVILGSMIFSILIGVLSGTFPAMSAAKLDPITALRYE